MRVLLSSNHTYPAGAGSGAGREPLEWPSGSGFIVQDLIAKGLGELGHTVYYLLTGGARSAPPGGVTVVDQPVFDVDVLHTMTFRDHDLVRRFRAAGIPWVATCHLDPTVPGRMIGDSIQPNWIFVSRTLARSLGRERYVVNGIDPAEFVFSKKKDDYLFFMASIEWAQHKGLSIALDLSQATGARLVVAGTGKRRAVIDQTAEVCRAAGATYVGDVRGTEKARLLSRARAVIFPTQVNEAFGLVPVEALVSGTPVICSANGACLELVSPDTGFVCRTREEYIQAVRDTPKIDPHACRQRALKEFHYLRMARDYVSEYEIEIAQPGRAGALA